MPRAPRSAVLAGLVLIFGGVRAAPLARALIASTAPGAGASGQTASPPPSPAWTIDTANSSATFAVRHMLVATVRGQMGPVSGTVWYDGTNVASLRADATIDVRKLSTGDADRDAHLRTPDFFAADQYPNMTFRSKRAVPKDAGHFQLIGDLTIRTTTKEVTLEVEGPLAAPTTSKERRLAATATTTIDRFDYGLKWNGLIETGGAMVGPDVKITIDLQVTRPAAPPR